MDTTASAAPHPTPTRRSAMVTGAAGFLGRHLVQRLVDDGWSVIAFCREGDRVDLMPGEAQVRMGDLLDRSSLTDALGERPAPVVFHLAGNTTTWARHRHEQWRDNVGGTAMLLDVAAEMGVPRLVYTSSISSYGWQPGARLHEGSPSNVQTRGDNYGKSKHAAEHLVHHASAAGHLSTVTLNPVNILGPGDAANWSRQLILPLADDTLRVIPPGHATWISVRDVVSAHVAAVDSPVEGSNIILGGAEASFLEVVRIIAQILGTPVPAHATSRGRLAVLWAASEAKAALTRTEPELSLAKYRRATGNLLVDDSWAREVLGLGRTPLFEMLDETISWLRDVDLLPAGPRP